MKHSGKPPFAACLIVAPRRGAWIETSGGSSKLSTFKVAPRRGAWIETAAMPPLARRLAVSHPAGVRGLKQDCKGEN